MNFIENKLPLDKLLFDPNNYRFQDRRDYVTADKTRFDEESVQERAYLRLKAEESLLQLKNSIKTNGFIPIERLVVKRYVRDGEEEPSRNEPEMGTEISEAEVSAEIEVPAEAEPTPDGDEQDAKYLVVEGNRRLAALKWIAEDYNAGVPTSESMLATLQAIPVVIVEADDDPAFIESLMGVRHVSGISQWGGYQRAKLVVSLRDTHGLSSTDVADRLGMKSIEVNRRYRAFKALQQMQGDEEFGGHAKSEMYPLFHEAVSLPSVKDWLGWDEDSGQFTNNDQLKQFYALLSPKEGSADGSDDQNPVPKLATYGDVRQLKEILPNAEAKRVLLDSDKTLFDAISIAKREELSRTWSTQVAEAIGALAALSALDLKRFSDADIQQLEALRNTADSMIEMHGKLAS